MILIDTSEVEVCKQVTRESKAAFENTVDGMFIVDDTSFCIDVNPAGCALLALTKEEIINQPFLDFIEAGLYWEDLEIGWKDFLNEGRQSGQFRLYRPNQVTRDIEYDAIAAILPDRNLWILRDIGSRKRTEQAIQENQDELENRVLQRTAELMASNIFLKKEIAERKRAELALVAATEEWEQTFNAIPDQLCILDTTGAILRANKAMRDRFEPTHSELVGLDYRICYFGTTTPPPQLPWANALFESSPVVVETTFPMIDGSYLVASYPLFDGTGKHWGAISSVRDITERAQARQALLESEERFRLLIEGVRDYAIFMLDQDGFIVSWNEGARRIYGYESNEILGKHFSNFYPLEEYESNRPECALKGTVLDDRYEEEGWRVRKDGTRFWANTILRTLRDDARNLRGFSKVTRDITEQKRTQAALKQAEEKYREIFENAIEGIFQSTPDGRFISANPAMARMFGYDSAEELIADRDIESQHYVDVGRRAIFKKLIGEKNIVQSFELQAYRKDRSRIWTSENVRAVYDETGNLLYYEGIVEDITKRKQVEAEHVELLRRLVTAQEDEQRRISRELHDQMGQSLAALLLGLRSLEESVQGGPVVESVKRLQDITSRIAEEMHILVRELRPTALDDLGLNTALSNYTDEWSQRSNVAIDFHSNGLLNQRLGSQVESTVYRIVQEALNNVMKHAKAQSVSVILEKRGNRVLIIVEDDGAGFDAEALLKTPARNRHFGLLGMQERVALVGGSFHLESTQGVGTTVLVHIPISRDCGETRDDG